jgi:predicted TIM-barrel fold metal-dependent hydrolase
VIRAYNIVSADYFKGLGDRLTPAAIIPMHTPDEAIAELEFVTKQLGSKVGMFGSNMARKVPAAAANDPDTARFAVWYDVLGLDSEYDYDPVWAKCVELGIAPTFHSASSNQGLRLSPTNFTYNHIAISPLPAMRPRRRFSWAASPGASRNCALRFSKAASAGPASSLAI